MHPLTTNRREVIMNTLSLCLIGSGIALLAGLLVVSVCNFAEVSSAKTALIAAVPVFAIAVYTFMSI